MEVCKVKFQPRWKPKFGYTVLVHQSCYLDRSSLDASRQTLIQIGESCALLEIVAGFDLGNRVGARLVGGSAAITPGFNELTIGEKAPGFKLMGIDELGYSKYG